MQRKQSSEEKRFYHAEEQRSKDERVIAVIPKRDALRIDAIERADVTLIVLRQKQIVEASMRGKLSTKSKYF